MREREKTRVSMSWGGAEIEGDTGSEAGRALTESSIWGSNSQTARSRPELKSDT